MYPSKDNRLILHLDSCPSTPHKTIPSIILFLWTFKLCFSYRLFAGKESSELDLKLTIYLRQTKSTRTAKFNLPVKMGSVDIPKKYKALVYDNPGTISTKIEELDTPEPGAGEVLVNL